MQKTLPAIIMLLMCSPASSWASELTCHPEQFGGKADGHTLNTTAIQQAIDTCAAQGGGRVILSGGRWLSGPIMLKNHIHLVIDKGSVLQAVDDQKAFVAAFIGRAAQNREALILANNVHDIAVTGGGTLDGSGQQTWWPDAMSLRKQVRSGHPEAFTARYKDVPIANGMPRPWLFELNNSAFVKIDNVKLTNSPMWNLVIRHSHNVEVNHLTVSNPPDSPNTDGIDIVSSADIHIAHADISTGDDHISIKSGIVAAADASSGDITISDSIMRKGHGISIGSETINGIGNVSVSRVSFIDAENGIRIKSGRDRGSLIGPFNVSHVRMHNVATPLLITDSYSGQAGSAGNSLVSAIPPEKITPTTPLISGVSVTDLTATGARYAMILSGLPEAPVRDLKLNSVSISSLHGIQARYVSGALNYVTVHASAGASLARGPGVNLTTANAIE
ncbi:glycoside hydrolase family 28 protein [Candidatus Pantoea multigeneris]|nr:glycosyl hydrolase family 28 protein [Pantoea multigeneris]